MTIWFHENAKKNHVLGPFNLHNSMLSFEIVLGKTRHLYEKNKPTLGIFKGGGSSWY